MSGQFHFFVNQIYVHFELNLTIQSKFLNFISCITFKIFVVLLLVQLAPQGLVNTIKYAAPLVFNLYSWLYTSGAAYLIVGQPVCWHLLLHVHLL